MDTASGPILRIAPGERRHARAELERLVGRSCARIIVCHPGSGGRAKCCPLETLHDALRPLLQSGDTVLWMIYEESVPKAAFLLCGADTFIGNDAGMTHLAAALGLKTVALFGPTQPDVWQPLGPDVTSLRFGTAAPEEALAERIEKAAARRSPTSS